MNRLKILRAQRGITQRVLAQKTGVTQPTISRLESNGLKPETRAETLHKLAAGLGVRVEDLLDDKPMAV